MRSESAGREHAHRHLDFPGFAQEFLRRNPDYICDYRRLCGNNPSEETSVEKEMMALRWGLSFPVRP